MGSWCMRATHAYKGPLIAISIGVGFMLVGAVPVAITFGMGTKGSATIIGVGFIGFGLLVVLPGICWCIVRRIASFRCCHSKQEALHMDDEYYAPDDDLATIHRKPSRCGVDMILKRDCFIFNCTRNSQTPFMRSVVD